MARHFLVDSMNKSDSETTQRRLHTATVDMVVIGIPHFSAFCCFNAFFWLAEALPAPGSLMLHPNENEELEELRQDMPRDETVSYGRC